MQGLTKRQREIIDFIEGFIAEKKYSPTYREIQEQFGFSSLGSVFNHIQSLKKKGILPQDTTQSRSLSVASVSKEGGIEVPIIGTLRGGIPIVTYPQIATVILPEKMVPPTPSYLLKVVGQELMEECIQEGDLILIKTVPHFTDGTLVLAQIDQTTLIKKAWREPPYTRLESSHPQVQPIILRAEHLEVLGVIHSLIRNYS